MPRYSAAVLVLFDIGTMLVPRFNNVVIHSASPLPMLPLPTADFYVLAERVGREPEARMVNKACLLVEKLDMSPSKPGRYLVKLRRNYGAQSLRILYYRAR